MYEPQTLPLATLDAVDVLRNEIGDVFALQSVTIDRPLPGYIRFKGQFLCDLKACYDDLRGRFERHGFTPMIRDEDGQTFLIAMPAVFNPPRSKHLISYVLLAATILSTLLVGALTEVGDATSSLSEAYWWAFNHLWLGLPYSVSLMLILGAHEMGHYIAARYHKVPVSLPHFIPFPIPPIGTMGAFIRLKAPVTNKRALFDVGAAGPLAGLIFAIPILFIGLAMSPVEPLPYGGYTLEGNSIFYALSKLAVKGQFLPNGSEDVFLSQVAWAGWVGLLVTGLNLIPVGQLDGGHIAYVLFGKRARLLYWPVIIGLVALAVFTQTFMWGLWAVLIFFLGKIYAEPLDDVTPLDNRRRWLAIFTLVLFLFVFVPIPLRFVQP
jgi:membrane-associated protease RseP (regulator of RpoE activity)